MASEKHIRSIVKALTWRFLATLTTTLLVYLFTGSFALALSVGALELVIKLAVYYVHERVWLSIPWGKK